MDSADWLDTVTPSVQIFEGDCLVSMASLPGKSVQTCVTSPPYFGLRDYGHDGQIGLEATPSAYVAKMVDVFREVRRVLRDDGTLWLNLGDTYARNPAKGQHKPGDSGKQSYIYDTGGGRASSTATADVPEKNLLGVPWRVAFALQDDGWYLRQDIIWHKPNPMPESVTDRCTKAHEYLFLLSKRPKYYFDSKAIQEPAVSAGKRVTLGDKSFAKGQAKGKGVEPTGNGLVDFYDVPEFRNRRSVWSITTKPYKGAHFATFPPDLVEPCIAAGSRPGDTVLDPFGGSGTTAQVALQKGRSAILCELNVDYVELAKERIAKVKR